MKQTAVVVLVLVTCCGMARADGTPKIQFDRTVYDFGTTSMVQSVTGTFTFQNVGDAELKVQKPSTSCGCTVAGVKPDTLKPGEKGELVFTLSVAGIRGHTEKHITVPSNDPQNPTVRLTVKADVRQVFDVSPQSGLIGDVRPGSRTNLTFQLRRTDGQPLRITKADTLAQMVSVRVEPDEKSDGRAALVHVEFAAEGGPRRFNEQVRLYAEESGQPVVTIPIFGRILGEVVLTPEALFWGITDPDNWPGDRAAALTTRRLIVSSTQAEKPLELQNLTSSLHELKLELEPVEPGKVYAVIARLAEAPKQSERGTISFDTNYASQPKVIVPVTINVLKR